MLANWKPRNSQNGTEGTEKEKSKASAATNKPRRTSTSNELDNPFPEPVELEITDSLDLHAFSPKDVKAVTIAYLDEARKKGFSIVRIIHGKGIGVQREIVRNVLSETSFVKGFKSGDEFGGGGSGSTVVTFQD